MKLLTQKIPLLIALVALLFVAASCGKSGGSRKPSNVDYYTCTMHPSVHAQTPGKCPICSMDLVPVKKQAAAPGHDHTSMGKEPAGAAGAPAAENNAPHEFTIPLDRQQLIGVTYATVEKT